MIIEMKLVELIYIGETNERYNNLEKYWFLISTSSISRIEDFISISDFRDGSSISRIEDFISISDFRDGKLKDLGI